MDKRDITASIAHVDSMLDRVDKVIGRERPEKVLRPDISYPRVRAKPVPRYMPTPVSSGPRGSTGYSQVVASGTLTGNEMCLGGYKPRVSDDCDPEGMWSAFEAEFDDMVAGMR